MPSLPIPVSGLPRAAAHPAPSPSAVMRPSPLRSRPRSSGRRPRAYRYAPLRPVLAAPAAPFSPPFSCAPGPGCALPPRRPGLIYLTFIRLAISVFRQASLKGQRNR